MFRAESLEALARSRRPRRLLNKHYCCSLTEELQDADPDDDPDPDDSAPRLCVSLKEPVGEIYALPAAQAEQTGGRCPNTPEGSNAPQPPLQAPAAMAGTPARPDLLDPVVLRTMPPQVAAFMLYEPRELPPWRTNWPPEGMDDGAWCG
jgi:hypothetical protein